MTNNLTKSIMKNMCKEINRDYKEEKISNKKYMKLKDYKINNYSKDCFGCENQNNQMSNIENIKVRDKKQIVKNINQEETLLLKHILNKNVDVKDIVKNNKKNKVNKKIVTLDELRAIIND